LTQFHDDRAAELRELFFETAQELLQALNQEALKLEAHPGDAETVRCIRRIVHTLKGDAAAAGCQELSELAHALEDALALEAAALNASVAEVALAAADTFEAMLNAYRKDADLPSADGLREQIRKLAGDGKTRKSRVKKTDRKAAWTEYEMLAMHAARKQGKQIYCITAHLDRQCAMPIAARQLLLNAISEAAEVLGTRPEAGSTENASRFQLLIASGQAPEPLAAKCQIPTIVSKAEIEALEDAGQRATRPHESIPSKVAAEERPLPAVEPDRAPAADHPAPAENILRVEAQRIDNVLNLVGELIIGKSMLQQALNEFVRQYPRAPLRARFADAMALQARVLTDLQRSVMKVRMVPVEQLYRRFPRLVRDVARQCGKQVDLLLHGESTDLDKSLLDSIAEPLTHLVRNAISHGLESPEERAHSGKPARGTIRLDTYHQANQFVVEVSDDGRGIDSLKVAARAVERGLVTAEEAARLGEAGILELIFRPGFTTADEVTEIAGRGVGLDVVRSVIQRLKGSVEVTSRPGQGATFRLQLPLTLAIIKALLFRIEQRLYAIPLNAVAEIARARETDLHQVDNAEVLQLRNQVLPVIRLGRRADPRPDHRPGKIFVLVIGAGERKLGLLVNAIEGEEELVIKALDDRTVETDLVSGASILGDGRVVLILNLAAVMARFAKARSNSLEGYSSGMLLSHAERAGMAAERREVQP